LSTPSSSLAAAGADPDLAEALACLRPGPQADVGRAVAMLRGAATRGVAEADCYLATLAGAGVGMSQSWTRAVDHLVDAAAAGSGRARGQLATLAAQETWGPGEQPGAEPWRTLAASVRLDDWTAPCAKRVLRDSPRTVAIKGFLPRSVGAWLVGLAAGRLTRALVFGTSDANPASTDARTNTAYEIPFAECDVVVLLLRARIAATIGVPVTALEPSQILHYDVGETFALHHDFLDTRQPAFAEEVRARGQRIVTFLVYLSEDYDGGETDFPALGLRHRGGNGDALYFGNIDRAGAPDPRTLHAGLPPTRGEKWLFSQWIRDRARI